MTTPEETPAPSEVTPAPEPAKKARDFSGARCKARPHTGIPCEEPPTSDPWGYCKAHLADYLAGRREEL